MGEKLCFRCDEGEDEEPVYAYRPTPESDDVEFAHPSCIEDMKEDKCGGEGDFDPVLVDLSVGSKGDA